MNIRQAELDDAVNLSELVNSLSHYYLNESESQLPEWLLNTLELKEFKSRISDNTFINLVYEKNNRILGYISIKNNSHIYHLFVSENHQKQGIASELWETLKNKCNSTEYTVRSSLYAVKVYEKFGFKKTEHIESKGTLQFQEMKYTQC